ncbi:unnamed protein product [Aureobasidium pullulans]|nr:unnamed protein product [Aureobasidium pullulans]
MGHHNSKSTQALYSSDRDDSPERPPSYKTTHTQEKASGAWAEIGMPNDEFHKQLEALEHKHALETKITDDDMLNLDFVRAKVAALEAAVEERDRTIKTQTGQLNSLEKKSKGIKSTNTLAPRSRFYVTNSFFRFVSLVSWIVEHTWDCYFFLNTESRTSEEWAIRAASHRPPPYTETPEEPWTTANQTPSKPPARTPSLTVERDEEILELHQRLAIRGKAVENLWKGNNKLQAELERLREYSTPDSEKTYSMPPCDNFIDYRDLANQHRQKIHQLYQQSRMEREAKDAMILELEKQVRDLKEYIGKKESDLIYYQSRCTKVWEEAKVADAQLGRMSQKVMRLEVEAHASKRVHKSKDDHVELLERELKTARLANTQHTALSRGVPVQDGTTKWVLDSQQDEISVTVSRVPSKLDSVVDYLIESIAETKGEAS